MPMDIAVHIGTQVLTVYVIMVHVGVFQVNRGSFVILLSKVEERWLFYLFKGRDRYLKFGYNVYIERFIIVKTEKAMSKGLNNLLLAIFCYFIFLYICFI
jgi:hypothetical protein